MARDSLPTPFNRAAWIRVAVVSLLLLLPPIVAWAFLGRAHMPAPTALAAPRSAKPAATAAKPADSAPGAHSLAGKVIDETGAPLGGVTVMFLLPGETISGLKIVTDDDGTFYLDGAPAKAGTLAAKRDGYATASLAVAAGTQDVSGLTLTVRKSQGVSGVVTDGEGKAVDHALVRCEGDKGIMASTGPDGKFTLATDPEGCTATASHPDYGSSEPQALKPGARNILELPSAGGIAGNVVDEQGKPVAQYTVGVESFVPADKGTDGLAGMSQQVNDPGGAFSLTNLARGKYVLTASAAGRPPAKSDTIEVTAGRVTRGVRITLPKGLVLSGTVVDRTTKKPIAGARISLDNATSAGATGIAPVTSDESGNFTLDGAPTGSFSIRVAQNEHRERIVTLDGRGKSTLRTEIDLAPGSGDTATELTGIGATLGQGAGFVFITSVVPDGPAEKAGVKQGDRVLKIDGQSAESFSIADCITRLRGPEGTGVILTVGRGSSSTDISITRAVIVR